MANRYIKSPYDVVAVNDVVTVWVKSIDAATRHVSLTMIKPGTEQKPPERRPGGGRPQGGLRGQGARRPRAVVRGPADLRAARADLADLAGPDRSKAARRPAIAATTGRRAIRATIVGPADLRIAARVRLGRAIVRRSSRPRRCRRLRRRRPRPAEPPKPKLSKEALEGKAPLRTFGELSALFAAKRDDKPKVEPPKPPVELPPTPEPPTPEPPTAEAPPPGRGNAAGTEGSRRTESKSGGVYPRRAGSIESSDAVRRG